jgi:hypothetical protein
MNWESTARLVVLADKYDIPSIMGEHKNQEVIKPCDRQDLTTQTNSFIICLLAGCLLSSKRGVLCMKVSTCPRLGIKGRAVMCKCTWTLPCSCFLQSIVHTSFALLLCSGLLCLLLCRVCTPKTSTAKAGLVRKVKCCITCCASSLTAWQCSWLASRDMVQGKPWLHLISLFKWQVIYVNVLISVNVLIRFGTGFDTLLQPHRRHHAIAIQ